MNGVRTDTLKSQLITVVSSTLRKTCSLLRVAPHQLYIIWQFKKFTWQFRNCVELHGLKYFPRSEHLKKEQHTYRLL